MKKNQKHNRVYMTLIAYSGANETQGRFFKGVKGTLRPGAILINADFFFFLTWIQIFQIFHKKGNLFLRTDFSENLLLFLLILFHVFYFSNLLISKVICISISLNRTDHEAEIRSFDDRCFEKVIQSVTLIYGYSSIRISRRDSCNLKLASMRMIV